MIPTTVFIEPNQENKIRNALRKQKGCRIKVRKSHDRYCAGLMKGVKSLVDLF